ncbi:MAG TPA: lytic murein transglycosylase [Nocardioides sp.]|nr:lytic murein transglycosylase [Nocardioides sp.]
MDANGTVDTTTVLRGTATAKIIRSAATKNGERLWATGGNGGIVTTPCGSSAATTAAGTTGSNLNALSIQGGQLFSSGTATTGWRPWAPASPPPGPAAHRAEAGHRLEAPAAAGRGHPPHLPRHPRPPRPRADRPPTESRVRGRTVAVTVAAVILLALAGLSLYATTRPAPVLRVQPVDVVPAAPPTSGGQPSPRPRTSTTAGGVPAVSPQWVAHTATTSGISAPAIRAYGGRSLNDDGRPDRPISGVPLDGAGKVARVPDSSGGFQRALGPMQFIPSTWRTWASDGDGDGVDDPQDLDDAAYAAARYLCASGGDLSTATGWSAAILSYNHSDAYVHAVYDAAKAYADRTS